jgi:serine/threonine protein kinase
VVSIPTVSGRTGPSEQNPPLSGDTTIPTQPAPTANPLTPTIPGYELLSEIHRGGQGVVYRARQLSTGQHVAVKLLHPGLLQAPAALRRFEREIEVLTTLKHPNIVRLIDGGTDPQPFLVMEYIDGRPLHQSLTTPLPTPLEAVRLMLPICAAVAHAHANSVVHRDLKPGNILIDQYHQPRVVDFGLAKALDSQDDLSQVGDFMGTLAYAAPEQFLRDPSRVDVRADVFALTALLLELLTGKRAPRPQNITPASQVTLADFPSLDYSTLRRRVPKDLITIILRGLAPDPRDRYETVAQLQHDLQCYLTGEPISARRANIAYVTRKQIERSMVRHPAIANLTIWILATLVALALTWFIQPFSGLDRYLRTQWFPQIAPKFWSDKTQVIGLDDASYLQLESLAKDANLPDVSLDSPKSWRRLHANLMHQLALAKPRAVVWDIYFKSDQPDYDPDFAAGVKALQQAGAVVVTAVRGLTPGQTPPQSELIGSAIDGWGLPDLHAHGEVVTGGVLALCVPDQAPVPSIALRTFLLLAEPGAAHVLSWDGAETLEAIFISPSDEQGNTARTWQSQRKIEIHAEIPDFNYSTINTGNGTLPIVALYANNTVPSPDQLRKHTTSYADIWQFSPQQLQRRFEDCVIIIGDQRINNISKPDQSLAMTSAGPQMTASCNVHAALLNDLLKTEGLRSFSLLRELWVTAATALLIIMLRFGSFGWWITVPLAVAIVAICYILALGGILLSPIPLIIAGLVAWWGANWHRGVRTHLGVINPSSSTAISTEPATVTES